MIDLSEAILDLGSDNLDVFGGKYEGGIHLQQSLDEIKSLLEYLIYQNRNYLNFLEIGSAAGGNTFLFNYYFDFKNIVIIDDNQHPKHQLRKTILQKNNYIEYIGNSQCIEARKFIEDQNLLFDIIFIDADHSYNGVKNDVENFKSFLNIDGFLILHDTFWCHGVKQLFNELKNNKDLLFIHEFIADFGPQLGLGVFQKNK